MKSFNRKYRLTLACFIATSYSFIIACSNLPLKEAASSNSSPLANNQSQDSKPNSEEKIEIDWSLIYPGSIASMNKNTKTSGQSKNKVKIEDTELFDIDYIYRKQAALESEEYNYAIEKLQYQLKDRIVDSYWSSNEDEAKLFLVTQEDVVADEHRYVFRYGKLAGFVISFVILPIADRSMEDMIAVYSGDENVVPIEQLIAQYGGEMQSIGYNTKGFLIEANAYFSKPLNEAQTKKLEAQLKQLTGVTIKVRQTGKLMY